MHESDEMSAESVWKYDFQVNIAYHGMIFQLFGGVQLNLELFQYS